eukprot:TRINITY_DN1309_c0_g1_i1.p1 TRINITY_DN1309_c0_g1~~TRINITY_DN1309_c0_g1_i1.p1  ORF type:complete len:172 (+),score=38.50 TRINITY_DN1309_c0_g1_i1:147-662(+)
MKFVIIATLCLALVTIAFSAKVNSDKRAAFIRRLYDEQARRSTLDERSNKRSALIRRLYAEQARRSTLDERGNRARNTNDKRAAFIRRLYDQQARRADIVMNRRNNLIEKSFIRVPSDPLSALLWGIAASKDEANKKKAAQKAEKEREEKERREEEDIARVVREEIRKRRN